MPFSIKLSRIIVHEIHFLRSLKIAFGVFGGDKTRERNFALSVCNDYINYLNSNRIEKYIFILQEGHSQLKLMKAYGNTIQN